ncbi:MAG: hypothetical protein IJC82_05580 [Firmicutes bacterium]|nr:hypothetical protein [Bacillota bacterium]
METKEIIEKLNNFCESFFSKNVVEMDVSLFKEAAERLEELEAELGKRTINDRPYEWISVEDEPYPDLDCNVNMSWHLYPQDVPCYLVFQGNGSGDDGVTHWMLIEPPKPKEPSFKDVFLEKFPKAPVNKNGIPTFCIGCVFPQVHNIKEMNCDWEHETCWNQPYFETEGEGEAE